MSRPSQFAMDVVIARARENVNMGGAGGVSPVYFLALADDLKAAREELAVAKGGMAEAQRLHAEGMLKTAELVAENDAMAALLERWRDMSRQSMWTSSAYVARDSDAILAARSKRMGEAGGG